MEFWLIVITIFAFSALVDFIKHLDDKKTEEAVSKVIYLKLYK